MNSERSIRNACKQWNGGALGVLALGILLSAVPALAQQDQQNPPNQSNPPATAPSTAPASAPQTQPDQTMPPQQDQQAQPDQQQQDQSAPPQQNQQAQQDQ